MKNAQRKGGRREGERKGEEREGREKGRERGSQPYAGGWLDGTGDNIVYRSELITLIMFAKKIISTMNIRDTFFVPNFRPAALMWDELFRGRDENCSGTVSCGLCP